MKKIIFLVIAILGVALHLVNAQTLADYPDFKSAFTPYLQPNTEVSNGVEKISSNWDHMSGKEKRAYALEFINQSTVYEYGRARGWICGQFAFQMLINSTGLKNHELYPSNDYDWSENGKWNIPVYRAAVDNDSIAENGGHAINCILVGPDTDEKYMEDPTKFSHWLFFEPQTNTVVNPGDWSMYENTWVIIEQYAYTTLSTGTFAWARPIEFDLSVDKENGTPSYLLVLTNPNKPVVDTEAPVLTVPENKTVEYGTSISSSVTGVATATDDIDTNPTVSFEDESTQSQSGEGKFNYEITRTWTAKDASENSESGTQIITVQDSKAPEFTGNESVALESGSDTSPESLVTVTATDNGEVVSLTHSDASTQVMDGSINQVNYIITRTWAATDGVGNESTFVQTITITDTIAPTFDWVGNVTIALSELDSEVAKEPTNLLDNSGVTPTVELTNYVVVYEGGEVVTVSLIVTDAAGNQVSSMRIVKGGDPIIPDSAQPHLLEIFREKDNLQIRYFADAEEKITVEVINIGSGEMVNTLDSEVVAGDNLIIIPFTLSSSEVIIRVIDANTTNVQSESFLDF